MKKHYLLLALWVSVALLMTSCSSSSTEEIAPVSIQDNPMYVKNMALTKAVQGNWNTDLVKENGVLVYSKLNQKSTTIDYGKFKLELNADSKFVMRDKEGNVIEGVWYVTKGNTLNLDYQKRDYLNCAVSSSCETSCGGYIVVTISFNLIEAPTAETLQLQNDKVDYSMKSAL